MNPKKGFGKDWTGMMTELLTAIVMVAVIIITMVTLYTSWIADIVANLTAIGGLASVAGVLLGVIYWVATIFVTLLLLVVVAKHLK